MSPRATAGLAWSVWALCVGLDAFAILLDSYTPQLPERGVPNLGMFLAVPLLVYATVGAFVVSRRPTNFVGWMLCGIGFVFGVQSFAAAHADYVMLARPGSWVAGGAYMACISQSLIVLPIVGAAVTLLILLFPNGRLADRSFSFVPWMVGVAGTMCTLWFATATQHFDRYPSILNPFWADGALGDALRGLGWLGAVILVLCFIAALISVLVRLANVTGEDRQRIKWFAYAAVVLLACLLFSPWLLFATPTWAKFLIGVVWLSAIPVAVGVAILRSRLYDIDVIINRTLVYGALTVMLAVVYFGGIVLLQRVFVVLTGEKSTLAVVISTLVIAAIFSPLRRLVQSFVDRRFYRRKYDARRTLEDFSAKLRDETDLDALNNDLTSVVRETVQPAHVSLWLRSDPGNAR